MSYLSKILHNAEIIYTPIEKLVYAIVYTTQKLSYYMITNTTFIVAQADPLRYLLSKPYLQGRPTKWIMYLQKFDLLYTCQKPIKGQVITDMITTIPYDENSNNNELMVLVEQYENKTWILFFDGSKYLQMVGTKIMVVSLEGCMIPMVYKFNFECINNMDKY